MRRPLYAVLLVSTAAIAYELLLMRMLSIVQWHHFAWMVIGLALLGYGASGTVIALARDRLARRFDLAFALSALLFSVSMVLCWMLAQKVPFNALEVVWDARQLLWLGALYLLFMVPFFFAALCIGMAFSFHGALAGRIYLLDLLGAGVGAVLVIALLFAMAPPAVLVLLSGLALAAAVLSHRGPALRSLKPGQDLRVHVAEDARRLRLGLEPVSALDRLVPAPCLQQHPCAHAEVEGLHDRHDVYVVAV